MNNIFKKHSILPFFIKKINKELNFPNDYTIESIHIYQA